MNITARTSEIMTWWLDRNASIMSIIMTETANRI